MLLQAAPAVGTDPVAAHGESYFSLMAKGGVILIPIFLLAGLAIFLIADKWHFLRKLDKSDNRALAYLSGRPCAFSNVPEAKKYILSLIKEVELDGERNRT